MSREDVLEEMLRQAVDWIRWLEKNPNGINHNLYLFLLRARDAIAEAES